MFYSIDIFQPPGVAVPTQLGAGSQFGQPPVAPAGMVMPTALGGGGLPPPTLIEPSSAVPKTLPKGKLEDLY